MDEMQFEQWEMGVYEDAIETWGREAQLMKAAEELSELAAMEGRTIGQVIDKLVRDRMVLLRDVQKLRNCHE